MQLQVKGRRNRGQWTEKQGSKGGETKVKGQRNRGQRVEKQRSTKEGLGTCDNQQFQREGS